MNKHYSSISILAALLVFGSCDNRPQNNISSALKQKAEVENITKSTQESPLAFETLTIQKDGPEDMNVHYKYVIDFPIQGSTELVNLIQKTIFNSLGDTITTQDFTRKKLEELGNKFIDHSVNEINELSKEDNLERTIGYGDEGSVKITENTSKYLTYFIDSYLYTGGAHGMPTKLYITIDKQKCKVLEWDDVILKSKRKDLEGIIQTALNEQYYKDAGRKWDDDYFQFSLPVQTPALTTKGVTFMYSAYEIDCYAAGTPHCTIPYEQIKDFLTSEAKALLQ